MDAGYTKPITSITVDERHDLTTTLKLHYTLLKSLGEMDQLKEGMAINGLAQALAKYQDIMKPLFIARNSIQLTAEVIKDLFETIHFSPKGSSDVVKEEATYMLFLDFLEGCERVTNDPIKGESDTSVSLEKVLSFSTGAESIPPLGFTLPLTLRFNSTNVFPMASTCTLELTLPTQYFNNALEFHTKMAYAMKNHGGFGCL